MRRQIISVLAIAMVTVSGCSTGAVAPEPAVGDTICTDAFCVDVPAGWSGEVGDSHIGFHHESAPDETFLTASLVDMEALVGASGGSWPALTDDVVRAFWGLLEEVDEGSLDRTQRMVGGAVRSWGSHSTGDMWFVLWPFDVTTAVGVEVRGPNDSWESHADVVFPTIRPLTVDR